MRRSLMNGLFVLLALGLTTGCQVPVTEQFYRNDDPPSHELGYWVNPEFTHRGTVGAVTVLTVYNCCAEESIAVDVSKFKLMTTTGDEVKILTPAALDSLKNSLGPLSLGFDPKRQKEVEELLSLCQQPVAVGPNNLSRVAIAYVLPESLQMPDSERKKETEGKQEEHFQFGDPHDPPEILRSTLVLFVHTAMGGCPPAKAEVDPDQPVLISLPAAPPRRFFTRDDLRKVHFNFSVSSDDFN